jgi:hypothetical protein
MRLGIILGFLLGAAVASILSRQKEAEERLATMEAPTASQAIGEAEDAGKGIVDKVKFRLDEARAAAREEAQEKEAELTRQFEETIEREKSD